MQQKSKNNIEKKRGERGNNMWNMQFTFDIKTQPNVSIMDPYTSIAEMIIICNAKKKIRSKNVGKEMKRVWKKNSHKQQIC